VGKFSTAAYTNRRGSPSLEKAIAHGHGSAPWILLQLRRMQHRHLVEHPYWSWAKVDDVLDRGRLSDWLELRDAVSDDRELAQHVLSLCESQHLYGTSALWRRFVLDRFPELGR
jgi:hypothetical protein